MFDYKKNPDELITELGEVVARLAETPYAQPYHGDYIADIYHLGELLKLVGKNPQIETLLQTAWYELARLLISTTLPPNFFTDEHTKEQRQPWELFFYDRKNIKPMKDQLLKTLEKNQTLRDLLKEKDKHNAFFITMRMQKTLLTPTPHLAETNHGAAVAWLLQLEHALPDDPKFKLIENRENLDNDSDEAAIKRFIQPYMNEGLHDIQGQPMRPDLFPLVAELAHGHLSFEKQNQVVTFFLEAIKERCDKSDEYKIYNKLLGCLRDLGKDKAKHHASLALLRYTMPLTTLILARIPMNKDASIQDTYLGWFSHKEIKKWMLETVQQHLNLFAPLLFNPTKHQNNKTMLDTIIDVKKSGFFGSTSESRKELNNILEQPMEMKPMTKKPSD